MSERCLTPPPLQAFLLGSGKKLLDPFSAFVSSGQTRQFPQVSSNTAYAPDLMVPAALCWTTFCLPRFLLPCGPEEDTASPAQLYNCWAEWKNYSPSGYILGSKRAKAAPWLIFISTTPDRVFVHLLFTITFSHKAAFQPAPTLRRWMGFFPSLVRDFALAFVSSGRLPHACRSGSSQSLWKADLPYCLSTAHSNFSFSHKQSHWGFNQHICNQINCTVQRATAASVFS